MRLRLAGFTILVRRLMRVVASVGFPAPMTAMTAVSEEVDADSTTAISTQNQFYDSHPMT